jgi:hypothetical protein
MSIFYPLSKGKVAVIEHEDLEIVSQYKWYAVQSRAGGTFYAKTSKGLYMHRLLCEGSMIDHRDGDTLNNKRDNLRSVTRELNQANRVKRKGSAGPYKNVSLQKGYWVAEIMIRGKTYEKWGLPSAEAARDLVEQWKLEHWGFDPSKDRK